MTPRMRALGYERCVRIIVPMPLNLTEQEQQAWDDWAANNRRQGGPVGWPEGKWTSCLRAHAESKNQLPFFLGQLSTDD